MSKHTNRVVAVTGGARGIGRQIATRAAAQGCSVAIGDIDGTAGKEAAAQLPGRVIGHHLDVTDRSSFAAFLDAVERELGPLDVLVNNAGIMPTGAFEEESDDIAHRQIDINVHGVLLGSKLALERMLPRQRGHIINVASGAGYFCAPGVVTYCGTKHAVIGITESLRLEYRSRGIDVTAVVPGVIDTELTSGLPETKGLPKVSPSVVAAAVVRAFDRPRAAVFVPRRVAIVARLVKVLPARAVDALLNVTGASRGYLDSDTMARAAYRSRIQR
jgi:NAD(P)-dependent dehydrogenase (short-subunit alcohol dehydrogenase family)